MKKTGSIIYLTAVLTICILPFAGRLWSENDASAENRKLSDFPEFKTQDGINREFLSQAGTYFEEHFAYRQEMVTANALIRGAFGVSAADGVIKGTDGWLYYKDSLDDYLGNEVLSEREIYNIAHSLKLMQDYVEGVGRTFLFTVAPNKNALYPQHMPWYDSYKICEEGNIDLLKEALQKENIHFADLHAAFEKEEEVLYHKQDSHWNNKGAALAAETLLDSVGRQHREYENAEYEVRKDFEGDLAKMLYPLAVTPEEEIYYQEPFTYQYVEEIESTFDPLINTVNEDKTEGLLMYRDSFGNALLPFLAEEFAQAQFSRGVPYYVDDMFFCKADVVIVERAQRFLPDMALNPPVMQSPSAEISVKDAVVKENAASCEASDEGMFVKLSGVIEEGMLDTDSAIYLRTDKETVYEAFPMTVLEENQRIDSGYAVYLSKERIEGSSLNVEVFVEKESQIQKVYDAEVSYETEK